MAIKSWEIFLEIGKHAPDDPMCCPSLSFTEKYKLGGRKGQYSIRINDQWRICFEWPKGSPGPVNVEIVDYH